jgi:hypothetical protein
LRSRIQPDPELVVSWLDPEESFQIRKVYSIQDACQARRRLVPCHHIIWEDKLTTADWVDPQKVYREFDSFDRR